ncbi:MAG TPA: 30S ribosomal protein S16 [Candidatus Paceibacterota bacterium]|nr:30S ribosomal protein S16 [Candidatus Paceibacterota bacterium]
MLKIRLQRIGKKHQAHYKVVVLEHARKPQGQYQEQLGTYDPRGKKLILDVPRVEALMSKGAQISPTVNNLMVNYKLWDRPKVKSWRPKAKSAETK